MWAPPSPPLWLWATRGVGLVHFGCFLMVSGCCTLAPSVAVGPIVGLILFILHVFAAGLASASSAKDIATMEYSVNNIYTGFFHFMYILSAETSQEKTRQMREVGIRKSSLEINSDLAASWGSEMYPFCNKNSQVKHHTCKCMPSIACV